MKKLNKREREAFWERLEGWTKDPKFMKAIDEFVKAATSGF